MNRNWIGNVAISQNGYLSEVGKALSLSDENDWKFVHQNLRNKFAGIAVGSETIIVDNPSLLTKTEYLDPDESINHPVRIIFDRRGRVNGLYKVFTMFPPQTIWITNSQLEYPNIIKINYTDLYAVIKKVNKILDDLKIEGDILVEGGAMILTSLINDGVVNKLRVFRSPILIENGVSLFTDKLNRKKILKSKREFGNGFEELYEFIPLDQVA